MPTSRRFHTPEFKQRVVAAWEARKEEKGIFNRLAEEFQVSAVNVRMWCNGRGLTSGLRPPCENDFDAMIELPAEPKQLHTFLPLEQRTAAVAEIRKLQAAGTEQFAAIKIVSAKFGAKPFTVRRWLRGIGLTNEKGGRPPLSVSNPERFAMIEAAKQARDAARAAKAEQKAIKRQWKNVPDFEVTPRIRAAIMNLDETAEAHAWERLRRPEPMAGAIVLGAC